VDIRILAAIGVVAFAAPAWAQTQVVTPVPYATGGIGLDEREQLRQDAKRLGYNLKIVTAADAGNYLGSVQVTIADARGAQVLQAALDGPWLYAKLPPGRYAISATDGTTTRKRTVDVPAGGTREVVLTWPRPEIREDRGLER